ncbi:hypothetical protein P153DRAFT_370716 [Dothidotthia symphoricarpi CBS 119687]|uniref:Uncharacterized protein n=1 Tax=Dothidotthia symphoricarpi CBS 119687 TaxID=1392245 RepID=A0A6A6A1H7_9PLEO|nr:uncharacterized protein P153DRAFT_370716 [Dothidotthia symphoricarpi CBS 119687]KAF2124807.1 hypothetical protein P153DRAFT_370716 [Dothidotthia symphoricarpi CBS 119687]
MASAQVDEKRVLPQHGRRDPESGASSLSLDKDVAIALVGEHARDIDPEMEVRVLRKIDMFLIPAMVVGAYCPCCQVVVSAEVNRIWIGVL